MFSSIKSMLCIIAILVLLIVLCTQPDQIVNDTTPPDLKLSTTHLDVTIGNSVNLPAGSSIDNVDGDISDAVIRTGLFHIGKPGRYLISYSSTDKSNNSTVAICTVNVIIPSNLKFYTPLDTSANDVITGMAGKKVGTVPVVDRFGNQGSAFGFDGQSYIEFPYTSLFNLPDSFAVSVWAKSNIVGSQYVSEGFIFDMGYVADRGYGARLNAANDKVIPYYNGADVALDSLPNLDTLWHHYVVQYTGSYFQMYIDSKRVINKQISKGTIDQKPFRIGAESKVIERYWNGAIDELMLFSNPLSDNQITNIATANSYTYTIDTSNNIDTSTSHQVTVVTGLSASINRTSGSPVLLLSWNSVPGVLGYGVYYNEGAAVTKNDYYRIASGNSKSFSSELIEGKTYTFAVTFNRDNQESVLSQPLTIEFK
jgi:hypothetical protein